MNRVIFLVPIVAMVLSGCYDPGEFIGGEIADKGLFSYPRYQARLGSIPLHTEGEYTFEFSGLPRDRMWLQIYIEGKAEKDRDTLENLSTLFKAEIKTKEGEVVCSASGRPSGQTSNRWTLMSSSMEAAYWHSNCLDLSLSEATEYQMRIEVSDIDARTPQLLLAVTLEGGGIELP
jgi:hypothetical protein